MLRCAIKHDLSRYAKEVLRKGLILSAVEIPAMEMLILFLCNDGDFQMKLERYADQVFDVLVNYES